MERKNIKLEYGSTGDDVIQLQQLLKLIYLFHGTITGVYGANTEDAVREFQENNNLKVTGKVEKKTWELLYKIAQPEMISVNDKPTIAVGANNIYVKEAKTKLKKLLFYNGEVNNNFDATFEKSVKEFQITNKLLADGIIGSNTWSALEFLYKPLTVCGEVIDPEPEEDDLITYTIVSGDTLYSLAKKHKTTVDKIKNINGLSSNTLSIGQKIKLPSIDEIPEIIDPALTTHVVLSGETFYSIAKKYGVTVDELKKINNITSNTIYVGQILKVPLKEELKPNINTYTVVKGDTLYSIAKRFDISIAELKEWNNLNTDILYIGQILRVKNNNSIEYIVKPGDTLYSIARMYNITVDELKSFNNIVSNLISVNQILLIPSQKLF